ncbi:annexin B9-like [Daphnia carinata]|uniref:annexin B9-like n=1 Tax=Daphnia carinata TaxID=120202 RepID=UPI00257B1AF2|nr:annexin B9-like [Daphnia carinata]
MEPNLPTVFPVTMFDAKADADALHKAIAGLGTDEESLTTILCHRSSDQRAAINLAYKTSYRMDLESQLNSELSGSFRDVMVALCLPKAEFMAREMYEAMSGIGTSEGRLIEILGNGTNQETREMSAAYQRLYGHPVQDDIKGDTSGDFESLLLSLVQCQRDETQKADVAQAKVDAQRLFEAGAAKLGTDEKVFYSILTTRSWAQLRQIIAEYESMHDHSLESAVTSEFSANAQRGILELLQCVQNRPAYLAERLHKALKGLGTNDRNLIRLIVSRCDVDLGNIKREYEKKFGTSLQADVSDDTSGDYKKALLTLIG